MSKLLARIRARQRGDRGSNTIEYGLLVGVVLALSGVLYRVVTSDAVQNAMSKMVGGALT